MINKAKEENARQVRPNSDTEEDLRRVSKLREKQVLRIVHQPQQCTRMRVLRLRQPQCSNVVIACSHSTLGTYRCCQIEQSQPRFACPASRSVDDASSERGRHGWVVYSRWTLATARYRSLNFINTSQAVLWRIHKDDVPKLGEKVIQVRKYICSHNVKHRSCCK